jgi:hypothetical protein
LAAIIDEDFGDVPSVDVDGDDHGVCVGNEASFTSWGEKVIGMWDHLVWVTGPSMTT